MADETDAQLAAQLLASDASQRKKFFNVVAAWRALQMTEVPWQKMTQREDGAYTMPYPLYPEELFEVEDCILDMTTPQPLQSMETIDLVTAPLGYVLRFVMATFRSERFADGAIARIVDNGNFDTALDRIAAALK